MSLAYFPAFIYLVEKQTIIMKKFIVIYHAPAEAVAEMSNVSPEQMAEGMKPWMDWAAKCGDQLVDMGTPLMGGLKLNPDGSSMQSDREVTGYSVLQAESMDEAKALLQGHPHLAWTGGCAIEIHESMPLAM